MVREGRAQYADPSSMIRAGAMLLEHIGFTELGSKLHKALDICGQYEKKVVMTGRDTGATSAEFGQYLMATVEDSRVESRWQGFVNAR
jgi:isocitrate dehydrogenase (NAD+)